MSSGESFSKEFRLRKQAEFDAVFRKKSMAIDHMLVVHGIVNGKDVSRVGLSVSRKVGNAVVRNRWKRAIRESFRRQKQSLPVGMDFVVRPRKGAVYNYEAIFHSLSKLTHKLARRLTIK